MLFLPFFLPSFNECHCSEDLIDYLEEEKYEYVPRELTTEQRGELNKIYKKQSKQIDNSVFLTDSQKTLSRHDLFINTFYTKELKNDQA